MARQRPGSGGRGARQERRRRDAAAARSRRRRRTPPTSAPAPRSTHGPRSSGEAGATVHSAATTSSGSRERWRSSWRRACRRRRPRWRPRARPASRFMRKSTSASWRSEEPAASASPAPTARRRPRRWSRTCSRPRGLRAETAGNIGRPLCDVAQVGVAAGLARARALLVPAARHPEPPARGRRPHQPRAQSPRPISLARGILRRQGAALPQRGRGIDHRSATRTIRRSRTWSRSVPGGHLRFSVRERADGWYDREAGRLMLGATPLLPRDELPAPGRSQRGQRAHRGARGGRHRLPERRHRGRAQDLQGDPAPGGAGAGGGRRALDQRLQVHQHHLDRGGGGRARPALRAAPRRAAQG